MNIPPSLYDNVKLPPGEPAIRILTLTTENGVLKGNLRVAKLSSGPEYTALSYTWMSWPPRLTQSHSQHVPEDETGEITCNGNRICRIQINLYLALVQLREGELWVDALCINQKDKAEKSRQVRLMGEIYSRAENVIVWLGIADDHTPNAAHLIGWLAQLQDNQLEKIRHENLGDPEVVDLLRGKWADMSLWRSLAHFFCRSWFARAWVMQEVILAKKIFVFCGTVEFDWNDIRKVSGHLSKRWNRVMHDTNFTHIRPEMLLRLGAAAKLGSTRENVEKLRNDSEGDQSDYDLFLDALIRARDFQCYYPVDKVYSCYGIGLKFRPEGFNFPEPDYAEPLGVALTKTARAILQMSNSLHVLAYAESLTRSDTPSWVPDWTVPSKLGLGITGYRRYWAADNLRQQVLFADSERKILRLRAYRIGYVDAVGNTKTELRAGGDLSKTRDLLRGLAQRINQYNVSGMTKSGKTSGAERQVQTLREAFWRTVIHNNGPDGVCPVDERTGEVFHTWQANKTGGPEVLAAVNVGMGPDSRAGPEEGNEASAGELVENAGALQGLDGAFQNTAAPDIHDFDTLYCLRQCLKLFRTNDPNNLIGVGAESIDLGDSIWIVPGSRVPLLIREDVSTANSAVVKCRLVGAAYVHGVMHGQMLTRSPAINFQTILDIA